MGEFTKPVEPVDLQQINKESFKDFFTGCIVVTQDNKLLLQQRGYDWPSYPGFLSAFGGHIEPGETPMQAIVRELHEELGAVVKESDVVFVGAVTESISQYTELVYEYFWHDAQATITGCYEGEAKYFDSVEAALAESNLMGDVRWLLGECQKRGLLKVNVV